MAFTTKLNLTSDKVCQGDNQNLILSGNTVIATVGDLRYQTHPEFTGNTQVVDKQYVDLKITGATGTTIYNLDSPAAVTVGGISGGTILTGKTSNEILSELLVPILYPTLTPPSESIALNPSTSQYEIGSTIATLCVTGSFNRGCINPQYTATCDKRSGPATTYCFSGSQVAGSYASSAGSMTKCATGYTILSGQSWGVCTAYSIGYQPKNSKGGNYSTILGSGTTSAASASITGIYPYYYGQITCATRPVVTNALITGGTKCQLNAGTCTSVVFSAVGQWTWFALPATCAARAYWCETALSRGCMASAPSDKYPDTCTISISSGQACWAGVSYKVYMSGTVGTVSTIALSSYLIP